MRCCDQPSFRTGIGAALCLLVGSCAAGPPPCELLETGVVESELLEQDLGISVLPAPDDSDPDEVPVVVILHGMGEDHLALDRHGVSEHLREAILAGRIPPVHLLLPSGDRGYWTNWHDGSQRWEDYLLQEAIPAGEAMLGTRPGRDRRHILGVSMGGAAALRIGLARPDLFASTACLSSFVMNREQALRMLKNPFLRMLADLEPVFGDGDDPEFARRHDPYRLVLDRPAHLEQKIFLAAGEREWSKFEQLTVAFHEFLEARDVEHRIEIYEGGHGWRDWLPVIEHAIGYFVESDQ
ncbi:MAG: alpha/beta hydrolase-fold protein [Polyangia bacterium]